MKNSECIEKFGNADGLCGMIEQSVATCEAENGQGYQPCTSWAVIAGNIFGAVKKMITGKAKDIASGSVAEVAVQAGKDCAQRYTGIESGDLNSFCETYDSAITECTSGLTSFGSAAAEWCKNTGRLIADHGISVFNVIRGNPSELGEAKQNLAASIGDGNSGIWKIAIGAAGLAVIAGTVVGIGKLAGRKKLTDNKAAAENSGEIQAETVTLEDLKECGKTGTKLAKTTEFKADRMLKIDKIF